ncbi:MAG: protein kinase [Candidatus Obscuribacterales bacterium]|nr:protein kinase [Cyanobacteria bacterium SZAS LIN-5]
MAKVLLVEDNQDLAGLVRSMLEFEDHTVHVVYTGTEGRDNILKHPYDLIILDWDLPGLSGIEILKEFRAQGGTTPVLILTGRQSSDEKETGLDEGADDYLTKPFDMKELNARIRAQLRRYTKVQSMNSLLLGDIVLDTTKQRATKSGRTVVLTPREYQLLEFCAKYPHLALEFPDLVKQVWPTDSETTSEALADAAEEMTDAIARTTLRRLRKKLDPEGQIIFPHIVSVSGTTAAEKQDQTIQSGQIKSATTSDSEESDCDDDADPFIGTIFDQKYELVELLGGGGTGLVYRAKHCTLGNTVAVKLLYPHLNFRSEIVRRFSQEARSSGILSHKNVIEIHDFGQNDMGQPYLVMELLIGTSLGEMIKKAGKLRLSQAADLFVQTCNGLAHAHEKGVLHRDVKPSNLMIVAESDGSVTVKLVDFGMAKPTTDQSVESLTRTGEVFGSPPYMSPEQCRGLKVDHRSDIYALGCVLYEMLTGKPPFLGADALQTIMLHINAEPPHLKLSDIPDEQNILLDRILQKCLEKDKEQRFQTVDELRISFEALFQ